MNHPRDVASPPPPLTGIAPLALLRQLAASLEGGQRPILALDVEQMQRHSTEQMRLCAALHTLASSSAQASSGSCSKAAAGKEPPQLARELEQAGQRVLHFGRVQAALLRRTRRFLGVLQNLEVSAGVTYGPPLNAPRPHGAGGGGH